MRGLSEFGVVWCKFGAIIAGFVIGVLVIEGCEKKRNGNTEQHEGTRDHRERPGDGRRNCHEREEMGSGSGPDFPLCRASPTAVSGQAGWALSAET